MGLSAISLCSGVGGLELGLRRALPGLRVVAYCERDPFAAQVLLARMEDEALEPAPIWVGDLREFDAAQFAGVDLVSAGYPCQPFSAAGKQLAEKDERHLWPEVLRIIRDVGPRYVALENVSAHVRLGFDRVLGDLAELGLNAEWAVVSAAEAGAPHLRKRLFCLAYRPSEGREGAARRAHEGRAGPVAERGALAHSDERGREVERVAQPRRQQGESGREPDGRGQVREQHDSEVAKPGEPGLPGRGGQAWEAEPFPPGPSGDWSNYPPHAQPAVRRAPHGSTVSPDGVDLAFRVDRLRCCGNAVVPAQAALAFRELWERIY